MLTSEELSHEGSRVLDRDEDMGHPAFRLRSSTLMNGDLAGGLTAHRRIEMTVNRKGSLPPEFIEGLRLYDAGEFWDSHEVWEEIWKKATGAERHLLQGLIQIDAALIHTKKAHWGGVMNLLQRSLGHLEQCPRRLFGLNVANIRKQLRTYIKEIHALKEGKRHEFDWSVQPRLVIGE